MGRYIDAEKIELPLINKTDEMWIKIAIDATPTADVRENVRGKWIQKCGLKRMCNRCGEDVEWFSCDKYYKFCPYCGAVMSESLKVHDIGKSLVDGIQIGIKGEKEK